jgi:hypothetical protein
VQFLTLDTEFGYISSIGDRVHLTDDEHFETQVEPRVIGTFLKNPSKLKCGKASGDTFIDPRVLDKVKIKGHGCGGWPILGKTTSVANFKDLYTRIYSKLELLTNPGAIERSLVKGGYEAGSEKRRYSLPSNWAYHIFIVGSLGGGTARGFYEVVTYLVRMAMESCKIDFETARIRIFNIMPSALERTIGEKVDSYIRINTYQRYSSAISKLWRFTYIS